MSALASARLRRRLLLTCVLVLVALGGAGLATAVDRPHTDQDRPELTARADLLARPWLAGMSAQLFAVGDGVGDLSATSREVLGLLQTLDPTRIGAVLTDGDQQAAGLASAVQVLSDMRDAPPAVVDETRLGGTNQALIAGVEQALDVTEPLADTWRAQAAQARVVSDLLVSLLQHDQLVFRATTAARGERWSEALTLIDEAAAPLAAAHALRDRLAGSGDVTTLNDLLSRYEAYDEALIALYTEVRDNGLASPQVPALTDEVERHQQALPDDTSALSVIVGDAAGGAVAEAALEIERARGVVADILAAQP